MSMTGFSFKNFETCFLATAVSGGVQKVRIAWMVCPPFPMILGTSLWRAVR